MRFRLIDTAKEEFPVHRMCDVLSVSPSGYFAQAVAARPVVASNKTSFSWRLSVRPSRPRMAPMAARA